MNELFKILMKFYWLVNQVFIKFDPTPLPRYLQGRQFHTQYMPIADRGKWQVRVNFKQIPTVGKILNVEPTVTDRVDVVDFKAQLTKRHHGREIVPGIVLAHRHLNKYRSEVFFNFGDPGFSHLQWCTCYHDR